jgi:hypothetical protein
MGPAVDNGTYPHLVSVQRRMWRVDDWFRPVRPDGTPRPPRVPTVKDRKLSAGGLVVAVVLLVILAATTSANVVSVIPRGGLLPLGYAVAQVVFLVRTRHLGWR